MQQIERLSPEDIERRSFEIIKSELTRSLDPSLASVIMRVIHATADFEYADTLCFSDNALNEGLTALRRGEIIITDTAMARAGINKPAMDALGTRVVCYMSDEDVAREAKARGVTRAAVSIERAALLPGSPVFAIGNAPTALICLCEMIEAGRVKPSLVIGAPVGFVNVTQSKARLCGMGTPYIVSRGRNGGSTVAAAIVNALMYELTRN